MTKVAKPTDPNDLGTRLALVADMLDQAVAALNETLQDIKAKEAVTDGRTGEGGNPGGSRPVPQGDSPA